VDDDEQRLRAVAEAQPPFAGFLGIRITSFSRDCVAAELTVGPQLANRNGVLHGGALMGFADNLGGTASFLNLPEGSRTTTIESKTNFFRPILVGTTASAECVPLHRGRRTSVWQTTVTTEDGKLAAVVTQTQLALHPSD
jgi:1,4-dihydroxy-2-naphthoyl-CoA hydrolase